MATQFLCRKADKNEIVGNELLWANTIQSYKQGDKINYWLQLVMDANGTEQKMRHHGDGNGIEWTSEQTNEWALPSIMVETELTTPTNQPTNQQTNSPTDRPKLKGKLIEQI
ncbi:hypothetical protein BLOT_013597 [Blomia tropicalis]|nr:hypothetical protein BLOT_013597 [Blomia tropicalis]